MVDYIVIGSGIGSFTICKRLLDNNRSFIVISDFSSSATSVAGGIINPIILKRFKPFWNALEFYNEALNFYDNIQTDIKYDLLSEKDVLRIFSSVEEQNNWFTAADKPILNKFLSPNLLEDHDQLRSEFKLGRMKNAFLVDAVRVLNYFHDHLLRKSSLHNIKFEHSKLILQKDYLQYENIKAKGIFFTEGFKALSNPFFSYLPIYGNRGDYLIFRSPTLNIDTLVKGKSFLIPLGNNLFKFGASFDRSNLTKETPIEFQNSLVTSLKKLIKEDFEIIRFDSGVRPNVKDRRPILGKHPIFNNMYIMNGFGSRGIFMSPLLSKWLYDHIENNIDLPDKVDIRRFQSYF